MFVHYSIDDLIKFTPFVTVLEQRVIHFFDLINNQIKELQESLINNLNGTYKSFYIFINVK